MNRARLIRVLSLILFVLFWSGLSRLIGDHQILPSPGAVLAMMHELAGDGRLQENLIATGWRVLAAFTLAMGLGGILGYVMGRYRRINDWLDPWLLVFLNLPALVLIVLCYLWIGLNEMAAILAVTLNKIPLVTTIVREGARSMSSELRDLAVISRLSYVSRLRHFVLAELYPHLVAAARAGLSVIWKIVLVVEFLGRSDGIGRQIHTQFSIFNVTGVLAYSLAFVICVLIVEFAILQPLERRATAWRGDAQPEN